jgi:hypothetical protein
VAQGNSRHSDKDKARLVEISWDSSFAPETQLIIAKAVSPGNLQLCKDLLKTIVENKRC